ncbi:MAG TPA: aldose epimerase family protein [Chitinophagaceae bacterium]|jgi:aldose 1-epimerase|nr:aldose epimerase family protein [Chitinophagaceae bacterium]
MRLSASYLLLLIAGGLLLFGAGCGSRNHTDAAPLASTTREPVTLPSAGAFRQVVDGRPAGLFYLRNRNGVQAALTGYGARLVSLLVPDKSGRPVDVVLGYDSLDAYLRPGEGMFGATVGRFANRIGGARFSLDGKEYALEANDGARNTLHSGRGGFHSRIWEATPSGDSALTFAYVSPAGEGGFPGTLSISVRYTLTGDNGLRLDYEARTDAPTVLNPTNHAYFNLNGAGSGPVLDHILSVNADSITLVGPGLIPTGRLASVEGSPLDFRTPRTIGSRIDDTTHAWIRAGRGYDHNFVLNRRDGTLRIAAAVTAPVTGIRMDVWTTEPGMQFYSANWIPRDHRGKEGKTYNRRHAFCLETQHFPDAPNRPEFPSTVLRPGEVFRSTTIYQFTRL